MFLGKIGDVIIPHESNSLKVESLWETNTDGGGIVTKMLRITNTVYEREVFKFTIIFLEFILKLIIFKVRFLHFNQKLRNGLLEDLGKLFLVMREMEKLRDYPILICAR